MLIDGLAVTGVSDTKGHAKVSLSQKGGEAFFAFLDRIPPQIRAVQLDQVKCAQRRRVVVTPIAKQVKDR